MPLREAFWRAILCNVLVCLAVWMAAAGRSVTDTSVAIVPPVTAFVRQLVVVIAGNLVGGSVLVALVYHLVHRRGQPA
ncbi:MAG: formate/nitrite transporter family protein [Rhodocyclaceae bacterium]|jgi:formate transporter|nr:formate/nitrite transporter family protein [Rhodocyclaceae bacterium]MCA3075926.1 formate/nitrite transporter family protein [Rhodocyclaceae bacterium]MCA3088448.1 formate/nitrite transporter family protein [Rhodocyclaceae bacterium]MCA3094348.1 formate/nitrite transporter family protein [Rhodocyclaceae bacterium]MCA3096692.1 formate/nitrite transporter family protein [Rhodocyclaceae bacterium]